MEHAQIFYPDTKQLQQGITFSSEQVQTVKCFQEFKNFG